MRRNTMSLTLKLLKYVHCDRQLPIGGRGSAWQRNLGAVSFLWVWCARHQRRLKLRNGSTRKRGNGGEGGGGKRRRTEIGEERLGGEICRRTILITRDSSGPGKDWKRQADYLEARREKSERACMCYSCCTRLSRDSNEG